MTNEVAILIDYKVSGGRIEGIDNFYAALKSEYIIHIRTNPGPQAGGLYDMVVQVILNMSFADFVEQVVIYGMLWDMVKLGSKRFFIRPFLTALKKLLARNPNIDFYSVEFAFDDLVIRIVGIGRGFTSIVTTVVNEVSKHFASIKELAPYYLDSIFIPITQGSDPEPRFVLLPLNSADVSDYLRFWGLEFERGMRRDVYAVDSRQLLNVNWK